jgi:signal transduction histidine kinase/type II secretory pathway pseudopilin PulG
MARLRLQTQLLVSTLLIICTLAGAILLVIRYTVRTQIAEQVKQSTNAAIQEFDTVQLQFQLQLSRTAAVLADIPTLKALMTTNDAPTIQDASTSFWQQSGSDLFLLADPTNHVVGLHARGGNLDRRYAEDQIAAQLRDAQDSAWWYSNGSLYWVFLRPITAGAGSNEKVLGLVAVGYEADSAIAKPLAFVSESKIVLSAEDRIIASTFPPGDEEELQNEIHSGNFAAGAAPSEVTVGKDAYQVAKVTLQDRLPSPVQCYVFVSLTRPMGFIRVLNRTILFVGLTAILLASLLFSFVSGTITRPLENLVAGVRALAAGDYAYSITPRGSSEVAELGEAFSKMRGELLAIQQKQIEIERVAALGRAANSISHDLRHYLATVVANAEFLYEAEKLKLDPREIYEEIQAASEHMTELLESLRDWARVERTLSPKRASMEETVQKAVDAVQSRPELREHAISVQMSGDMAGIFDPLKIERVFLNLALNACEAMADRKGRIAFEISSTPDQFEIRISDNGPGIPASIRDTLFAAFVSEGKSSGTGLGLAIVSKIVHDHGGAIVVESTSEKGTTFLVTLPRFQPAANEISKELAR